MTRIKHFLALLILNSVNFFAMNMDLNGHVKKISKKINQKHLGISKHTCFESPISTLLSYYNTFCLPSKQARQEIIKIESYLPKNDKKIIFKKLVEKHWYIYYLIQILVNKKIEKFKNVNGSTIDQFLSPKFSDDSTGRREIIYTKAYHKFFIQEGITSPLAKIPSNPLSDTQFILLYADTDPINTSSIIISEDKQYLRAYDTSNKAFTWSLCNGNCVSLSKNITWQSTNYTPHTGLFHLYWISDCYAIHHNLHLMDRYKFPIAIDTNKNGLLLYKHPDEKEYLTRIALKNSFFIVQELTKLQKYINPTGINNSFSQQKLYSLINNQIRFLEKSPCASIPQTLSGS